MLEFGLRRAQGIDGGVAASRAAYVGGCAATTNVLAGKLFGIPVKGTHAHSWVMSFDDELESFEAYADGDAEQLRLPRRHLRHARGRPPRRRSRPQARASGGHEMVGIRLDSGDLAYLSIEARKILDAAGFPDAQILASNDLDEHIITSLKEQGATINVWGVGTKLVTAYDQPALGGVYKLSAQRDDGGTGSTRSSSPSRPSRSPPPASCRSAASAAPAGEFIADAIYDEERGSPTRRRSSTRST